MYSIAPITSRRILLKIWGFTLLSRFMKNNIYATPLRAIEAFEKTTALSVSIHDFSGSMYNHLPQGRFLHQTPCCLAAKAVQEAACLAFDVRRIRAEIHNRPDGMIKVCHAGLVEWVVPHLSKRGLDWMLFAGQRIPGVNFKSATWDSTLHPKSFPWKKNTPRPPEVNDAEAQIILEMLRQLSARLILWQINMEHSENALQAPPHDKPGTRLDVLTSRRAAIRHLIDSRHRMTLRLSDLAEHLHISESRASHAVREAFGESFIEVLVKARLKTATNLLRYSNLSVIDVAERSGFSDLSHFHHTFRNHLRRTPLQYRKKFEQII